MIIRAWIGPFVPSLCLIMVVRPKYVDLIVCTTHSDQTLMGQLVVLWKSVPPLSRRWRKTNATLPTLLMEGQEIKTKSQLRAEPHKPRCRTNAEFGGCILSDQFDAHELDRWAPHGRGKSIFDKYGMCLDSIAVQGDLTFPLTCRAYCHCTSVKVRIYNDRCNNSSQPACKLIVGHISGRSLLNALHWTV